MKGLKDMNLFSNPYHFMNYSCQCCYHTESDICYCGQLYEYEPMALESTWPHHKKPLPKKTALYNEQLDESSALPFVLTINKTTNKTTSPEQP